MLGNTDENLSKTNNEYNVSYNNVKGHVTSNFVKGNNNTVTNYVSGDIKIDDNSLNKLNPVFQDSIKEFIDKLDALLKEKKRDSKTKCRFN